MQTIITVSGYSCSGTTEVVNILKKYSIPTFSIRKDFIESELKIKILKNQNLTNYGFKKANPEGVKYWGGMLKSPLSMISTVFDDKTIKILKKSKRVISLFVKCKSFKKRIDRLSKREKVTHQSARKILGERDVFEKSLGLNHIATGADYIIHNNKTKKELENKVEKIFKLIIKNSCPFVLSFDLEDKNWIQSKSFKDIFNYLYTLHIPAITFVPANLMVETKQQMLFINKNFLLGIHSFEHKDLCKLKPIEVQSQIKKSLQIYKKLFDKPPVAFRAPFLHINNQIFQELKLFKIDLSQSYKNKIINACKRMNLIELPSNYYNPFLGGYTHFYETPCECIKRVKKDTLTYVNMKKLKVEIIHPKSDLNSKEKIKAFKNYIDWLIKQKNIILLDLNNVGLLNEIVKCYKHK